MGNIDDKCQFSHISKCVQFILKSRLLFFHKCIYWALFYYVLFLNMVTKEPYLAFIIVFKHQYNNTKTNFNIFIFICSPIFYFKSSTSIPHYINFGNCVIFYFYIPFSLNIFIWDIMNKYIPYFPLLFSIIYELMKRNIVQYVSCFTSLQCYGNHCNLQYLTSFIYDATFIRKSSVLTSSNFWSKNIHRYVQGPF